MYEAGAIDRCEIGKRNIIEGAVLEENWLPDFLFKLTISIQIAVLNGFGDMISLEVGLCLQIGDGAGNF